MVIRGEKGRRREEGGGGDKERKRGEKGGGERLRRRGWRKKVGERRGQKSGIGERRPCPPSAHSVYCWRGRDSSSDQRSQFVVPLSLLCWVVWSEKRKGGVEESGEELRRRGERM